MELDLAAVLKAYGFPARRITQVTKEKTTATTLIEIFTELSVNASSVNENVKTHLDSLVEVAGKFPKDAPKARSFVVGCILKNKLGPVQREEAFKYFKTQKDAPFEVEDFEKKCGVGVVVTAEQIKAALVVILEAKKAEIAAAGDKKAQGLIWPEIKKVLPFAAPSDVSTVLASLMEKKKENHTRTELVGTDIITPVTDNKQATPELLKNHLEATGGIFITRFPPEPNGYLHIGHAKSMNLNFGIAKKNKGKCIMRFDDTNPATEEQEYIDSILENVKWMGHEFSEITYASDYFDQLYLWAIELINRGLAYVCHQTPDEIEESRKHHTDSPFRNRPIEENLSLFEDMKNGKFEEGKATLRMKMDMKSGNSCMWDLVAYRIKFLPHHRTGKKWCIYPSYDFTHCLCDTIENITHSLCTLEFRMRRESYNWLVDSLGLYRSKVFEFARLALTHTILSKRKLIQLVTGKYVTGWDDPRLSTIQAFRRKGYSPSGINAFCDDLGITTNVSVIPIEKLEQFVRLDLNKTSRRIFCVFDPIAVTIKNWTKGTIKVTAPNVPGENEKGNHQLLFSNTFFIERSDFKEEDEEGYFGLALNKPNKFVKLKYADVNIRLVSVEKDSSGKAIHLIAEEDPKASCKNAIHWINKVEGQEPIKVEVREYEHLFLSADPIGTHKENWLKDLNPHSLKVVSAIIDLSVHDLKPLDRVQFERVGYYCTDPDSKNGNFVFNRTVSLKESNWKKTQK